MPCQFVENVSPEICDKLSNISFSNYKKILSGRETEPDVDTWKKIKSYCKSMMKSQYKKKQTYDLGKANGLGFGRNYVQGFGLQSMTREFRSALCRDSYHDIDMVNCAPNLILKILKEGAWIDTTNLTHYINNREECLEDLFSSENITRSQAKELFIKCLYSQFTPMKIVKNGSKKKIKNKFFVKFDAEIKSLQCQMETSQLDLQTLMKLKDRDYHKGKLMCHVVQKLEAELLNMAISLISEENPYIVPIFDGFLIQSENHDDEWLDNFLLELETKTGVKWSVKPPEYTDDFILNMDNSRISFVGHSDRECGDKFIQQILNNNFINCHGTTYLLSNGKWIDNEKTIKSELKRIVSQHDIIKQTEMEEGPDLIQNVSSDYTLTHNMVERGIINQPIRDDAFIDKIWEKSLLKIYFENGYYDFNCMEFFEDGDETFIRAPISLDLNSDPKIRAEIYKRVLHPIFTIKEGRDDFNDRTDLMRYMMTGMSKMMAGNVALKKWFLATGMRDSGKGVLAELLKSCFGKYVGFSGSSNFKMKTGDIDAKSHSWIINYQFKRMAICSEIIVKENSNVDGTMIKQFCSGGDVMEARKNFKDEMEFKIQAGLLIFGNDMPPVQPSDAYEKCDKFEMKSKFVSKKEFESNESNDTIEFYEKDDNVKTHFSKDPAVLNEFILMLIEAYTDDVAYPDAINEEVIADMDGDDDEKNLVAMFVTKSNGIVSNEELRQIASKMPSYTLNKIKKILKAKLGAKNYRDQNKRGLSGIMKAEEVEED